MVYDKLPELVDDGNGVFIALSLRISPGEEAVTAEDDTVTIRTCLHRAAQHHGQFEAGALPWNPNQMVVKQTIEFFHLLPAVRRSSQGDAPVRMQVIDVRERQKTMQRRVDRGGNAILTEGAQRIHLHHFVFIFRAAIFLLEALQLFRIQRGQPSDLDTSQIAAAALDPQNFFLFSAEGIRLLNFRTGVSPAKVGDAKVGAQQIRAVTQQFGWVETASDLLLPTVFQIAQTCFDLHGDALSGKVCWNASLYDHTQTARRASKAAVIILH